MEQESLWTLFFATGLPEAWLAIRSQEQPPLTLPEGEDKPQQMM